MELNVLFLVYAVLQFIAFFFVVFATPLDMFVFSPVFQSSRRPVVTLWGLKNSRFMLRLSLTIDELWASCPNRVMRFHTAQALDIVSILVYGAAFALGVVIIFCCSWLRFVCVMLNIVGAVTLGVVWGLMMVTLRTTDGPDCLRESVFSVYGIGFYLLLAAWGLNLLNTVVLLIPLPITIFSELDSANDNSEKDSKGQSEAPTTQQEEEEDDEYE